MRIDVKHTPRAYRVLLPAALGLVVLLAIPAGRLTAVVKSEAEKQMAFGVKVARMGAWNEAAFRFEKAARADDRNPHAFNNLAVALESVGRFDEAREAYEKALELTPDDPQIKANYERFLGFIRSSRKVGDGAN